MRQLDDGIGDTLVLALKALGDGRSRCYVTSTSTSAPPTLPSLQTLTVPDRPSYRDLETRLTRRTSFPRRPNTKVSPIPSSN